LARLGDKLPTIVMILDVSRELKRIC